MNAPIRWAVVAAVVVLVACAKGDDDAPAEVGAESTPEATTEAAATPEQTPAPEPEPSPPTSDRGNVIKEIGEVGGLVADPNDTLEDAWMWFEITDIEVDGECNSGFADPPENGTFIIVSMGVETAPASEWPEEAQGIPILFYDNWSIVGSDGLTESAINTLSTATCLAETDILPYDGIGPGESVVGKVVLDSRNTSGVLIWSPFFDGGWEWKF